jgi:HSP20 family protein
MKEEKHPTKKERDNNDKNHFFDNILPIKLRRNHFSFFDEFEEQIERMEKRMNQLYNGMIGEKNTNNDQQNMRIYGWTYHVGPDGQPHFQEYSNIPTMLPEKQKQDPMIREPHIDVQETDKEIYIAIELPGVNKKDIHLETLDNILKIEVDNEKYPYRKDIALSTEIINNKTDAIYNNGVLSITLEKQKEKKKGKKINIK